MIDSLRAKGFSFFEIETNGTIIPDERMLAGVDWWNCSPKLSHSLIKEEIRYNRLVLEILGKQRNVDFKFVIRDQFDLDEIKRKFGRYVSHDRIVLMPESSSREDQLSNLATISRICLKEGYRLTPRLHTILWDGQRGK